MWYLPWGLVSARWGTRAATVLKSSRARSTRASLAMASRWRTALVEPPRAMATAMAFSKASLVMIWRGRMPALEQLDHGLAGGEGRVVATAVDGRGRRAARQRHAEGLGHRGHGVGGEHPGARSLGRAGVVLDEAELLVGEGVDGVGPHRLEHRGDVEGPVPDPSREDGPAVEEDAGQVEPGRGHEHAGQRLVAPGQGDHAVEPLGVHHRLHRVGDDLAADQRGPHALVAHGDAVGDGDGHELEGEPAGLPDPVLGPLGQPVERAGCTASPRSTTRPRRSGACPSRRRSSRRPAAWPGPGPGWDRRSPRSCGA